MAHKRKHHKRTPEQNSIHWLNYDLKRRINNFLQINEQYGLTLDQVNEILLAIMMDHDLEFVSQSPNLIRLGSKKCGQVVCYFAHPENRIVCFTNELIDN